jgi:bifunctional non-homologous end joining protein LigD
MALQAYREKRDFSGTPEPYGAEALSQGNSFVVQKHAARRLHYDLRLEMDGALKSWAVTRGPSLAPGEKRLAVHVEDHPLDYGDFEGVIPKGEYGAGKVIVWDRGRWSPIGDAKKGYEKGHLDFDLFGEKLKGRWHLARMRKNARDKHENWLLIKGEDEFAQAPAAPDILEERPESVKSGLPIAQVADKPFRRSPQPAKYQGAKKSALIDGEIVVEDAVGASDFSALQRDLSEGRHDRFRFYAFDLLYLNGFDLRSCTLKDRRARIASHKPARGWGSSRETRRRLKRN